MTENLEQDAIDERLRHALQVATMRDWQIATSRAMIIRGDQSDDEFEPESPPPMSDNKKGLLIMVVIVSAIFLLIVIWTFLGTSIGIGPFGLFGFSFKKS
jgi:hypothetical protein